MHRTLKVQMMGVGLTVFCLGCGMVPSPASLREAAQRSGMLVGTAARPEQLTEAAYAATLAREFNMLEPEDAMKWEVLRPDSQSFDFSQADRLVDFAGQHSMKVRGHTLVWHQQNPPWLTQGQFTPDQLAGLLETHIKTVVGHYRGKVFAWDVANEAFDEQPRLGQLRDTIWYNRPGIGLAGNGTAYLERCFRWAREADPQALLFYNEAEAEALGPKSDAIYAMVQDFRKRGVPIDGVGFEMHIGNLHSDISSFSANVGRFTALGVQVQITEMDVSLPVDAHGNASAEDLQRQADMYRQVAAACLSHRGCTAIQTWGFTDKYSWIGWQSKGTRGAGLLFDRNYVPKPAYQALRETLGAR
ncbi:MAG: endo-1,4-beta-xylanase [Acidobacteriia bacterium]|nr:endo-1,4-beta-xylanase [Terriglobia bacterium]